LQAARNIFTQIQDEIGEKGTIMLGFVNCHFTKLYLAQSYYKSAEWSLKKAESLFSQIQYKTGLEVVAELKQMLQ